jgi:hypothetical protein
VGTKLSKFESLTQEVKHFSKKYHSEEYRIADSFVISTDGKTLDTGIQGGSIYYWMSMMMLGFR